MRADVMRVMEVMEVMKVMNAARDADAGITLPRTLCSALLRF
jgi:hypothetical protein